MRTLLLPATLVVAFFVALPVVARIQCRRREIVISLTIWAVFITTVVAAILFWIHSIEVSKDPLR